MNARASLACLILLAVAQPASGQRRTEVHQFALDGGGAQLGTYLGCLAHWRVDTLSIPKFNDYAGLRRLESVTLEASIAANAVAYWENLETFPVPLNNIALIVENDLTVPGWGASVLPGYRAGYASDPYNVLLDPLEGFGFGFTSTIAVSRDYPAWHPITALFIGHGTVPLLWSNILAETVAFGLPGINYTLVSSMPRTLTVTYTYVDRGTAASTGGTLASAPRTSVSVP